MAPCGVRAGATVQATTTSGPSTTAATTTTVADDDSTDDTALWIALVFLLLVLGGPIGIYEVDRYPFLKEELSIIETAVKKDVPTIGICLGCRLYPLVSRFRTTASPA